MKAITIRQPWAALVAAGVKAVENRSRPWHYRGPVAIHAGGNRECQGWDEEHPDWVEVARPRGLALKSLPFGAVVAVATLVACHPLTELPRAYLSCPLVVRPEGPWCLVLEGVRATHPIPCPGKLGLWELPEDVLRRL